jgi:NADH dehydrogenase
VLTRAPERARHLSGPNVEIYQGDVRNAADVAGAVRGCTTVVSAMHGFAGPGGISPSSVDRDGNLRLIDAARNSGAAFVLTSIVGASAESPMELFRAKYVAEEHLRKTYDAWTIVRATAFVETWAMIMGNVLRSKGHALVFGRGDNPINFVSAEDVAALLELAVTHPDLRGRVIELGGPDDVTFNQFAAELGRVAQIDGPVRHIPRPMLRAMAFLMRPFKPQFARQAHAAVVMDTEGMTFDASRVRASMPDVPTTDLTTALTKYWREACAAAQ